MERRKFLALAGNTALLGILTSGSLGKAAFALPPASAIRAVAFDAFPIFDPRPGFKTINEIFPDKGEELRKLWFSKIFGYTWLRTIGRQYKRFDEVMADALSFSAKSMKMDISAAQQKDIIDSFFHLPVWPDVIPALKTLRANDIRLAFLSNMSEGMLRANMKHNNIEELFEFALSTDRAQSFKPSPQAYQLGIEAFHLKKEEIAFAAFAGWDAAGAGWFGYPTFWINRLNFPNEELDVKPLEEGKDLNLLIKSIIKE